MRDITVLVLLLVPLGSAASGKYYSNTNDYYLLFKLNHARMLISWLLVLYSFDEYMAETSYSLLLLIESATHVRTNMLKIN